MMILKRLFRSIAFRVLLWANVALGAIIVFVLICYELGFYPLAGTGLDTIAVNIIWIVVFVDAAILGILIIAAPFLFLWALIVGTIGAGVTFGMRAKDRLDEEEGSPARRRASFSMNHIDANDAPVKRRASFMLN